MPMPKSVTKINKNGVTYISNVDRVQYTMKELIKAALRDVAKILRYTAKKRTPKDEGNAKKNIGTWVREDRNTGEIALFFGVYNAKTARKKNLQPASFYFHILEFGSRFVRGLKILTNSTMDNLDNIRNTQAKYLSFIENETKAMSVIKEEDEVSNEG